MGYMLLWALFSFQFVVCDYDWGILFPIGISVSHSLFGTGTSWTLFDYCFIFFFMSGGLKISVMGCYV